MENSSDKVFTNRAISVATFFGGPITAGFLISKNFKIFGNDNAARNSIFIGVLSTVVIYAVLFIIPEHINDKIPQSLIPSVYTAIIALLVNRFQGENIKNFLENSGEKASNWLAAVYGLLGLGINIVFLIVMIFAMPSEGYEKSLTVDKNVSLNYGNEIGDLKSERIASVIKQSGFMTGSEGADLFLSKEADFYRLKFVIPDKTVLSDSMVISEFNRFEKILNYNACLDKRIEIGFTDKYLLENTELLEVKLQALKLYEPMQYLKRYKISDTHSVYYNSPMNIEDVKIVERAVKKLKSYFPINKTIGIIFLDSELDYTIKFFVAKTLWEKPSAIKRLRSTVDYIRNTGLNKNINLVLVDKKTLEEKKM
jgi:hypothetical protein